MIQQLAQKKNPADDTSITVAGSSSSKPSLGRASRPAKRQSFISSLPRAEITYAWLAKPESVAKLHLFFMHFHPATDAVFSMEYSANYAVAPYFVSHSLPVEKTFVGLQQRGRYVSISRSRAGEVICPEPAADRPPTRRTPVAARENRQLVQAAGRDNLMASHSTVADAMHVTAYHANRARRLPHRWVLSASTKFSFPHWCAVITCLACFDVVEAKAIPRLQAAGEINPHGCLQGRMGRTDIRHEILAKVFRTTY